MAWQVEWTRAAFKDLKSLDRRTRERIQRGVRRLAETGYGDVERIQGSEPELRLRIGDWRVLFIYMRDEGMLQVLRILPRGGTYKK